MAYRFGFQSLGILLVYLKLISFGQVVDHENETYLLCDDIPAKHKRENV